MAKKEQGEQPTPEQNVEAQLTALREENRKLKAHATELTRDLQAAQATKGSKKPTAKVGDKHVQVMHALRMKGPKGISTVKSAEDIAKDTELLAQLLKNGSSAVKVINI